jgi:hypothetical protein
LCTCRKDARLALDEGLAIAQKNDERFQEAELHRLKGELLLAETLDQAAGAEDCFRQAIETARRHRYVAIATGRVVRPRNPLR